MTCETRGHMWILFHRDMGARLSTYQCGNCRAVSYRYDEGWEPENIAPLDELRKKVGRRRARFDKVERRLPSDRNRSGDDE